MKGDEKKRFAYVSIEVKQLEYAKYIDDDSDAAALLRAIVDYSTSQQKPKTPPRFKTAFAEKVYNDIETSIAEGLQRAARRSSASEKANEERWARERAEHENASERNPNGVRTESERNPILYDVNCMEYECVNSHTHTREKDSVLVTRDGVKVEGTPDTRQLPKGLTSFRHGIFLIHQETTMREQYDALKGKEKPTFDDFRAMWQRLREETKDFDFSMLRGSYSFADFLQDLKTLSWDSRKLSECFSELYTKREKNKGLDLRGRIKMFVNSKLKPQQ